MKPLRIFMVWGGNPTRVANSSIWFRNVYDSLVQNGHHVFLFDIDASARGIGAFVKAETVRQQFSSNLSRVFFEKHEKENYDIFLSYLHSKQILQESVDLIKAHVFTINYTTNFHQFRLYSDIAPFFNLNTYASKPAAVSFDAIGASSYWMPFAANPNFYRPCSTNEKTDEIVFVGSPYGPRPYFLWRALQSGLNVHIYGPAWKYSPVRTIYRKLRTAMTVFTSRNDSTLSTENLLRKLTIDNIVNDYSARVHGPLDDLAYTKRLARASIVVNIPESRFNHNYLDPNVLHATNLRDFEATMAGSFLCTQYSEEVEDFFEEDKEVVTFRNEIELVDKLKYYSKNPSLRAKIALAGHTRALRDHTWQKRFEKLFRTIAKDLRN